MGLNPMCSCCLLSEIPSRWDFNGFLNDRYGHKKRKGPIFLERIQVGVSTSTPRSIAGTRLLPGLLRPGTRSYMFRFASLFCFPKGLNVFNTNTPAPADHKTLLMISNIPSLWDSFCICRLLYLSEMASRWDSSCVCWSLCLSKIPSLWDWFCICRPLYLSEMASRWDSSCVCWSLWLSKTPSLWDSGRIYWSFFLSKIPSRWDSICVCWSLWLSKITSRWDSIPFVAVACYLKYRPDGT